MQRPNSGKVLKVIAGIVLAAGVLVGVKLCVTKSDTTNTNELSKSIAEATDDFNKRTGIIIGFCSLIPAGILWGIGEQLEITADLFTIGAEIRSKEQDIYHYLTKQNISIPIESKDKAVELTKLGDLREKGILTEEEFKREKNKILG